MGLLARLRDRPTMRDALGLTAGQKRGPLRALWGLFGNRTTLESTYKPHPLAEMLDADTLACRGGTGTSRNLITIEAKGPYYHIATFYRSHQGEPMVVEMVEEHGGRILTFSDWMRERASFPGEEVVDVYRPDKYGSRGYNRSKTVDWLVRNIVGQPYGHETIKRFAREASWVTCWWYRACTDEDAPAPTNWVCSTAKAGADKYGGGVHPVSALWVGDTNPTMLVRGNLYDYSQSISVQEFVRKQVHP